MEKLSPQPSTNALKRPLPDVPNSIRPKKKIKTLLNEDDSSEEGSDVVPQLVGVAVNQNERSFEAGDIKVNEEYARRFEYNKKREELSRLQNKYGALAVPIHEGDLPETLEGKGDDFSDSSSDEDEDDDGVLALGALDEQVQSTLEAIRNKDPRVYDVNVRFYSDPVEEADGSTVIKAKKERPLYLSDYHRKNLLDGSAQVDDNEETLSTYQQQQADLKDSVVREMRAAVRGLSAQDDIDGDKDDDFLIRKPANAHDQPTCKYREPRLAMLDVESAKKDPEAYLSNFMSSKAWLPNDSSKFQPFESDDEDEDRQAEAFEEAYNLRFENPKAANEKLLSHARDAAAKHSVRKEETNPRKKKRDIERARKDSERQLQSEEKARLRKLKIAELEEKVQIIKDAAGIKNEILFEEDWSEFLNDAWDDNDWEREMKKRFGDDYYNKKDVNGEDDEQKSKKSKIKKPKWDDDIDINDLVPNFNAKGDHPHPAFELTDRDVEAGAPGNNYKDLKKSKLRAERERKKDIRLERRKIEQVVDEHLDVNEILANYGKNHAGIFRYRETSPLAHGLTAHDILMADDSQLNQFAGLKKLAPFRDPDKKKKDKKYLGKKQRLKQWRKDTFGNEHGPAKTLAQALASQDLKNASPSADRVGADGIREGERKKKRSRKAKSSKSSA